MAKRDLGIGPVQDERGDAHDDDADRLSGYGPLRLVDRDPEWASEAEIAERDQREITPEAEQQLSYLELDYPGAGEDGSDDAYRAEFCQERNGWIS